MLSLCDTSASVFGRLFGRYTPPLPLSGRLFGAKKSLAGTTAAVLVGMTASYVFWSKFAARGDEGDVSWVVARMQSGWRGKVNEDSWIGWGLKRLPNPQRCGSLSPNNHGCIDLTPLSSVARSTSARSPSSTVSRQDSLRSVTLVSLPFQPCQV